MSIILNNDHWSQIFNLNRVLKSYDNQLYRFYTCKIHVQKATQFAYAKLAAQSVSSNFTDPLSFSNHRDLWCPAVFKINFIIIDVEIKILNVSNFYNIP